MPAALGARLTNRSANSRVHVHLREPSRPSLHASELPTSWCGVEVLPASDTGYSSGPAANFAGRSSVSTKQAVDRKGLHRAITRRALVGIARNELADLNAGNWHARCP